MRKKPRSTIKKEDLINTHNRALRFLNDEITEEEYFSINLDSENKNTIAWPELYFLQLEMDKLSSLFKKLTIHNRCSLLLTYEIIGMSHNELNEKYGLVKDQLRKLIGKLKINTKKSSSVKIRKINGPRSVPYETVAFLSVIARVTPNYFLKEDISNEEWSTDHFEHLPDSKLTADELIEFLRSKLKREDDNHDYDIDKIKDGAGDDQFELIEKTVDGIDLAFEEIDTIEGEDEISHDIRGITLKISPTVELFLRIEELNKGIVIEVFNKGLEIQVFIDLLNLLSEFNIVMVGYVNTVISTQKNFTLVIKNENPVCLPVGFHHLPYFYKST